MTEHYFFPESAALVGTIDEIARSHNGREQVFSDFLTMTVCALAGGTREEEYLQTVQPYCAGEPGQRDIDKLVRVFANLIEAMERTRADILGDIFQGAITRGSNGQFFTPDCIGDLMARLTAINEERDAPATTEGVAEAPANGSDAPRTVSDPCCGSGRLLLAAAKVDRNRYFVGQDIDHRCVKITAINLALNNLVGRVVWGNTLTLECKRIYHTGFNGRGVIRVEEPRPPDGSETPLHDNIALPTPDLDERPQQRSLFDEAAEE